MNRNLDGIYLRVKRDGKYQPICLSDMIKKSLRKTLIRSAVSGLRVL